MNLYTDNAQLTLPFIKRPSETGKKFRGKLTNGGPLFIHPTWDSKSKTRARNLFHSIYSANGLEQKTKPTLKPFRYNDNHDDFSVLAQQGAWDCGTVSLVFDGPNGLPGDASYSRELSDLRTSGHYTAEVTQLAIINRPRFSKQILVGMFNLIYIYARRVMRCDDFVIEVNPRHQNYYRRLLGFESLGGQRNCHRVGGAPAVLLKLDLAFAEREILRLRDTKARDCRSLYPWFHDKAKEDQIVETMKQMRFFSKDESGRRNKI